MESIYHQNETFQLMPTAPPTYEMVEREKELERASSVCLHGSNEEGLIRPPPYNPDDVQLSDGCTSCGLSCASDCVTLGGLGLESFSCQSMQQVSFSNVPAKILQRKEECRIRRRKAKKLLGWVTWVVLPPVALMALAVRERPLPGEDDQYDDPLRPWSYKVHYHSPAQ